MTFDEFRKAVLGDDDKSKSAISYNRPIIPGDPFEDFVDCYVKITLRDGTGAIHGQIIKIESYYISIVDDNNRKCIIRRKSIAAMTEWTPRK